MAPTTTEFVSIANTRLSSISVFSFGKGTSDRATGKRNRSFLGRSSNDALIPPDEPESRANFNGSSRLSAITGLMAACTGSWAFVPAQKSERSRSIVPFDPYIPGFPSFLFATASMFERLTGL